jgi:two-component system chemotaxis sensor kinase CheA
MDIDHAALMQVFLSDSEEDLARLEEAVLSLEDRPDDFKTVDAIFRIAHTLKGNASILTLDGFSRLAHAMEDVLHAVRGRRVTVTGDLTTLLLSGVDTLRGMLVGLRAGRPEESAAHEDVRLALVACAAAAKEEAKSPQPDGAAPGGGDDLTPPSQHQWGPALRIETAKIDHLFDLVASASVVQGQITAVLHESGSRDLGVRELNEKSERLLIELRDWVMDARMMPVSSLFRSHARTVRDVARAHKKRVRLRLEGEEVRVDSGIGDAARDVLPHLIRNAIDHGIEPPAVRAGAGKSAEGTITLRAAQKGNQVLIQVIDDGAGFNLAKIRARARALGRPNVDALPADALYRMVFEPGFSTADKITELSGRGVGMDVVLQSVEGLHGTVDVESTEGSGTTIELRLPLTLSVIEGFWVEVGGADFVLPLDDVVECLELPSDLRETAELEGIIDVRGEPLVYLHLRELVSVNGPRSPREQIVVVRRKSSRIGLVVDGIRGQRQTVIKPLGRLFRSVAGISGSTLRADGGVALVIDVARLLRSPFKEAPRIAS